MANLLLISANITQDPYPVYPLGMSMVAHDVRANGHQVVEWDFLAVGGESTQELLCLVEDQAPDIIGISLRNIDNCNYDNIVSYIRFYHDLVKSLRSRVESPIVLGGPGYSLFPETLLERFGADFGIVGEGEGVLSGLIDDLVAGRTPTSRILKNKTPLKGNQILAPERNSRFVDYYLKQGSMLNLQTKRGCPFTCAYCSYPSLEGNCYRYRPVVEVVDEIQLLINKYKANYYFITDSVFNDTTGRYLELIEEIVRRNIQAPWMGYFKPHNFRQEEVNLLKQSGLSAVEWGTDCSTDVTLERMDKNFTWSQVEESNRLFSSAGIPCAHFIIFGGPGETEKTVNEGLSNIARLENCVVFASTGVRLIPGTPIHGQAIKEGVLTSDKELLEPFFYFSPMVASDYLHHAIKKNFNSRLDRIYPHARDLEKVRAFHKLGYRGPIWDLLLGKRRGRKKQQRGGT